jgi:alkylated DNA repair dioxygenase AlkB
MTIFHKRELDCIPVTYYPGCIPKSDQYFETLKSTLDWVRIDKTPRSEYYANDFNEPYTYGAKDFARTYQPQPWTGAMLRIRGMVETLIGSQFEVVFLNYYKDQSDHLGWHSDNSPEMDDGRPIVIVSFGVARDIWFAPIGDLSDKTVLNLGHGSIAVMHPGMQDTHMHRIPKASFMCGERISLTFRGYNKG